VAEDDQVAPRRHGRFWRRVISGLIICVALLVVFHRPLLLAIGRKLVLRYAAKENLKADFRVEGNPFSHVTIRNLHAFSVGPSEYESIDIDYLYLNYSLLGYARHGLPRLFNDVEARSASIILNPAKAPLRPRPPKPHLKLPRFFPERFRATDTTVIVRNQPYDFIAERIDLELDPRRPGELRIQMLQLPSGDTWKNVAGQTSYADKNLILRDFNLSDQEQLHLLNVDASRIDSNALPISLNCTVGGGHLSASAALTEAETSLNAKVNLAADKVAAESLNKFLVLPENYLAGEIERLALDGSGVIDQPLTWHGTLSLRMSDVHRPPVIFDRSVVEMSAKNGRLTLRSADIFQANNEFHFRGETELPAVIEDFGRTPASLEISGTAPDLEQLTAGMVVGLTGSAQFTGRLDIVNATVEATLGVTADAFGFQDGIIDKLTCTLRASKRVVRDNTNRPWFADLRTTMNFDLTGIRYRDYVVDSVEGSLTSSDDILGLDRLDVRRKQNEMTFRGRYLLPAEVSKFASQPAEVEAALNASDTGDFWVADSASRVSGPLQSQAQISWKQETANGVMWLYGSNLRMRDLVLRQVSTQGAISNNVVYLNDFSASLNDTDFVNATGTLNLQRPYHYSGKISANVANLSTLQPLLRASGNQNA